MTGPRVKARSRPDAEQQVVASVVARADAHMQQARQAFTKALLSHIRAQPDAALRTREALGEIDEARAELARLNEKEGER